MFEYRKNKSQLSKKDMSPYDALVTRKPHQNYLFSLVNIRTLCPFLTEWLGSALSFSFPN